MGEIHTVVQGEYLSKIARSYGFASYLAIWNAPENIELKKERKNPNILFPGDRLFIPDREPREERIATGQRHRFKVRGEKLMLRIAIKDLKNHALNGNQGTLTLETDSNEFTTSSDGIIERLIPDPGKVATGLLLDRGRANDRPHLERRIPLRIGNLDPETKLSGQIARLNNLGYDAGAVPELPLRESEEKEAIKSLRFRSAVEEFQCDFGLTVDGICGEKTANKLKEVHGC